LGGIEFIPMEEVKKKVEPGKHKTKVEITMNKVVN
jgi:hypothetical protein